jgi:hypothetical protein
MSITSFLDKLDSVILNPVLEVLFAVAFLYFLYAIIQLIVADGTKKSEAKNAVLWSIVGMFIMISVYGLINLVLNTLHTNGTQSTQFINSKLGN